VSLRGRVKLLIAYAAFTTLGCGAVLLAAVLAPAPPGMVPFAVLVCVGCPMAAAFEMGRVIALMRDPALAFRAQLDRLPETAHPLGL
jgi:hypothetical protein